MLTAAHKDTKRPREILALPSGALLTSLEGCQACFAESTGAIVTGPCRLVGAILNAGAQAATLVIESESQVVMKIGISGGCRPVAMTFPIACAGDLVVTLAGTGADAVIYYIPE